LTVERNDATRGTERRRRKKVFNMVMIFAVEEMCSSSGEIISIGLTPFAQ
jgi:hypothetical protein